MVIMVWFLVRDAGGGLVDQTAGAKALELERLGQLVVLARGQHMCQRPAAHGDRFETAGAPTAVDVQARHRRGANDGA